MNLPILAAAIVKAVRESMQDSVQNQADTVAGMIREQLSEPCSACEIYRKEWLGAMTELERTQNALDNYWREHPDTAAAAEAAMRDLNKYRLAAG